MRPYDDYDAQHDIETIENGGEWGTGYCRDGAAQEDVDAARERLEKDDRYQNARGSWDKD